jgi:hypothetical protein
MFSGFLSMIEGHLGEQMMADMSISDVMHGVIQDWSEGTIDGAESSSQPVPFLSTEVRHEDIGVLEESDQNQVVVGDHVWD